MVKECKIHGIQEFMIRKENGSRCRKCVYQDVKRRRIKVKKILVEEAGGKCQNCGYDKCIAALEFHHVDRANKTFGISSSKQLGNVFSYVRTAIKKKSSGWRRIPSVAQQQMQSPDKR